MADPYPHLHLTTRQELRSWLEEHHDASPGIWLVSWRRREPRVDYDAMVEECLCFGWIDSTLRVIDDDRNAIRLTPRRRGSGWSRSNKERIARLERENLIRPAGRAVIEQARADGSWELLDDVEALVVPPDLAEALDQRAARPAFDAWPPGRRKQSLWWIKSAKRPATRQNRIRRTADDAVASGPQTESQDPGGP